MPETFRDSFERSTRGRSLLRTLTRDEAEEIATFRFVTRHVTVAFEEAMEKTCAGSGKPLDS